jgi:hypothetical protein
MHPVQCPAPATGAAVRAGHLLRWVAPLCVFRRETRVLAVGALASTTCNNFIADLLFLSEVPHSLLVAGVPSPCVHPYLGKSALLCCAGTAGDWRLAIGGGGGSLSLLAPRSSALGPRPLSLSSSSAARVGVGSCEAESSRRTCTRRSTKHHTEPPPPPPPRPREVPPGGLRA